MSQSFKRAGRAAAIAASSIAGLLAASAEAADPFRPTPPVAESTVAVRSRNWAGDAEIGGATLTLIGSRRKTAPAIDALSITPRERISAWEGLARASLDISSQDNVGVSATALMERRWPSGLVSHGRAMASRAMAVALEWTRADRLHISAGWFASAPRTERLLADRVSERGGDALPGAEGFRLAAGLSDAWGGAEFGLDARLQRVSASDARLAGRTAGTSDARVAVAFRTRF